MFSDNEAWPQNAAAGASRSCQRDMRGLQLTESQHP